MSRRSAVIQVARWEFRRFFKVKDVINTLILFMIIGGVYVGVKKLVDLSDARYSLTVVHAERLPFTMPDESGVQLTAGDSSNEATFREAVEREELDGLLILESVDRATLVVREEPPWRDELAAALTAARRQVRIAGAGLTAEELQEVLAPFQIDLDHGGDAAEPAGAETLIAAGVLVGLMLMGVFMGISYLFIAITGEKTQRVGEQIISAIPIQTWIDGKILGHALLALTSVVTTVLAYVTTNLAMGLFGESINTPAVLVDPALLVLFALMGLLGFFFWFTFFAAVAATIDDPNSSTRSAFLLLPVFFTALGFLALLNPENPVVRLLSVLPVTSPAMLPARFAITEVPAWEVLAAAILLLGGIWFLRRAAGKIFELSILMYGKEPSWREMFRQLRQPGERQKVA